MQLPRPQAIKMLWHSTKTHELQDSPNKRYVLGNENMQAGFEMDRVHMFTMNKTLSDESFAKE